MFLDQARPGRRRLLIAAGLALLSASACRNEDAPAASPEAGTSRPVEKGGLPPTGAALTAHHRGIGLMEQFEHHRAVKAFREVRRAAPDWLPATINLAIALLNDDAPGDEGKASLSHFDEALELLDEALERDPENLHALFCRGVILAQKGNPSEAHKHFLKVAQLDPLDAASWFWAATTITDADDPSRPPGPAETKAQIVLFEKALAADPYLAAAYYRLAFAYRDVGNLAKRSEMLARWAEINPDRIQDAPGPGNRLEAAYGSMGRYGLIISPVEPVAPTAAPAPRFAPAAPFHVKLSEGDRWAAPEDFEGERAVIGRVRARFGAGVAAFDADGDGKLDLYLTSAVVGPKGPRDVLLLNKGEGRFEDASAAFGLAGDRASLGVAAGDFDADRRVDLFLTGVGGNLLLRNQNGERFEDVTETLGPQEPPSLSLSARWLDLDQDGDLDLVVVNYTAADHADAAFLDDQPPPPGLANTVYRNDGLPAPIPGTPSPAWAPLATADIVDAREGLSIQFTPWTGPEVDAIRGGGAPHVGVAAGDLDGDGDLDLILTADGAPAVAALNDRLGRFRAVALPDIAAEQGASGVLAADFDGDGRVDLAILSRGGPVRVWRNTTERQLPAEQTIAFEPLATDASGWRSAVVADLDLDGRLDLLGLASRDAAAVAWARNEGGRLATESLPIVESEVEAVALGDLVGDALPDLVIVRDGEPPLLAENLGNGNRWLSLRLEGRWRVQPQLMRGNSQGLGARVIVEGRGLKLVYDHATPDAGLGQSTAPIVLGLGDRPAAELVRVRWPDGVLQCELDIAADQSILLAENSRRMGGRPVLFTWNDPRLASPGAFHGGGGMGAPVPPKR